MPNVEKPKQQNNSVVEKKNKWIRNSKCRFKSQKYGYWEEVHKAEGTFTEKISKFEWDSSEARRKW